MIFIWIKRLLVALIFLGLGGAGIILAMDNMNPIGLTFLSFVTEPYPLFVWLIGTFLVAFIVGFFVGSIGFFKNVSALARLRKELNLARESQSEDSEIHSQNAIRDFDATEK